ncbi:MAG: outer membrane protein assembly factor BamA [Desulfovibrionaceae bacterium]|nr:outer membrane protein assembly factor BamA [Desulfovibrionaceae bacterium]
MPGSKARAFMALVVLAALAWFSAPGLVAAAGSEDIKVAVLPFEVNAGEDLKYLRDSLPELISDRLAEAGFKVVDRADSEKALDERAAEFLDLKLAKEIALLTGAGFAVYGSFSQVGETISIDARLVEAFGLKPAAPLFVTKEGLINLLPAADDLVAQITANLLKQDRISDIEVRGTNVLDKEVVLMRLGLKKGDVFNARTVNSDLKSVYELGYFDDVKVAVEDTAQGKRLIFTVKEKPRIQAIGVTGAKEIDSDDILEAVTTKKGAVVNPKVLGDDLKTIREMYRKEGYYKATVRHEIEDSGQGQARLNFVVDEGPKLYIKKIIIDGAKQIDPDDLKDELALQEKGLFSWFTSKGALKEELLERDAAAIMAFYANRGFIDAKVGQPEVEIKDDGIYVTFKVFEGSRFKVADVQFEGDLIADPEKLKTVIGLDDLKAEDEYLSRSVIQEDVKALTSYYNDFGYAYAETSVRVNDHPEEKTVDVIYVLSKHQRVRIRRVLVEGNTRTRDNIILRELRLADGDQFSGKKLQRSTKRLESLGYFDQVSVDPLPTGDPDLMDLKVKVKEKNTGRIGGGVGYSTYDGVGFGADITEGNLFGKGYSLGLNGAFSGKSIAFNLNFMNPHYNDTALGVGGSAYHRTEEFVDYHKRTVGGQAKFTYPLGEYTGLTVSYTLDNYEIFDLSDTASSDIKDEEGSHISSSISLGAARDTTNRRYNPSQGSIIALAFVNGGGVLLGDDSWVKYKGNVDYFTPVINDETVLHLRGNAGWVHENIGGKGKIPLVQRFTLGGMNSVRGYGVGKITAHNLETGESIGGDKELFTNVELIYTVDKEMGISLVGFFDAGGVWKEGEWLLSDPKRKDADTPPLGLYKSVGAGIRWFSPMGPLRIEYGYGLDELYDSSRSKIEFSMGQTF